MKIKDVVLDILFPRICVGCGREGKYICDKCSIFISESEPTEARPPQTCGGRTSNELDGLTSIWDYEGLIKELIHMIKYQGVTDIIKELLAGVRPGSDPSQYPYITYVPMYLKKEKQRGFNQAELIARELAKKVEVRPLPLLKKIKDTEDQAKLNKEERLENVKNSFVEARPLRSLIEATRGRASVLLVDDVFTTGATMNECCKVLKNSGIKKVWGFTLARAV